MPSIDPASLTEKQRIELASAEAFLRLYNRLKGRSHEVVELSDTPDVRCRDTKTGESLDLEVTLLEDRPDDIPYIRGRVRIPDELSLARVIDFARDVIPRLRTRLADKLLSNYGRTTALLIRQVGPLWSAADWRRESSSLISLVLMGREQQYGKGVWILCRNTSTIPASDELFALYDPDVGLVQPKPTIVPEERVVGKVTWESNIAPDFEGFAQRSDVDPPIRIDSPHGCQYTLLIAFVTEEPEPRRQEAIEFYRNQMVFFCPCGRGKARMIGNWFSFRK